jgi:putative zinc binding protein
MKVRAEGCVICGATWGDFWREIEGQRMFFCCSVCADEFSGMVEKVKKETGWGFIDEIEMNGGFRGRTCVATRGPDSYGFFVSFNEDGSMRSFLRTKR